MKLEAEHTAKPLPEREWQKGESLTANLNRIVDELSPQQKDTYEHMLEFLTGVQNAEGAYELFETEIEHMLTEGEFWEIVRLAREALVRCGVQDAQEVSLRTPAAAVAFAEAINLAAKEYHFALYALKPALIIAAWKLGAKFGKGGDDAYFLFDSYVGTASFHNPGGEIEHLIEDVLREQVPEWVYPWSGIPRQGDVFDVLRDFKTGEGVIPPLRDATTPEDLARVTKEEDIQKKRKVEHTYVLYSAHFIDEPEALKQQFPPVHPNQYYDHCTIEFQPAYGRTGVCVGEQSELRIVGRVTDEKVDALLVEDPISKNKNPHITLSVADGIRPSQSNESIMHAMEEGRVQQVSGSVRITQGYHTGSTVVLEKEYVVEE